jgi:hypothetical protein
LHLSDGWTAACSSSAAERRLLSVEHATHTAFTMASRSHQHRRQCRFCGRSGTTEEHILPRSWSAMLGMAETPPPGTTYWLVHAVRDPIDRGHATTLTHEKKARRPAFTTRAFCQ